MGNRIDNAQTGRGEYAAPDEQSDVPHDKLPDAVYALLAKDLDTAASTDTVLAKQPRSGISELNRPAERY